MSKFEALRDPALRLAVVETLSRAGKLDLGKIPKATGQDRVNTKTLQALVSLAVPDRALAGLHELWWEGGGHKVQHQVWPLWHGEDDTFYVHSLAGIEGLAGLRKLTLATDADLQPLQQLPELRWARLLLAGGQAKSAVLAELRARKVEVIVEGMDAVPKSARPLPPPQG
ncbi:DUF6892 domain-containing protein [Nannocystis punicea]|uniref:DUF6892 domain-containing protein n=1 Tax=Nannocystis punicea TaxID=2995304 RepID=A0ABY7GWH6_9BACT|nr:hypothetical protein [Nannocystis poenicansa]WAS91312.1 hypothetical protein O0S08_34425 [Nannocystis poenicansa]